MGANFLKYMNSMVIDSNSSNHVALIAHLVEHCTSNAKVVGSNPVQSLNFFHVIFPVFSIIIGRVMAAFTSVILSSHLIATVGYL